MAELTAFVTLIARRGKRELFLRLGPIGWKGHGLDRRGGGGTSALLQELVTPGRDVHPPIVISNLHDSSETRDELIEPITRHAQPVRVRGPGGGHTVGSMN